MFRRAASAILALLLFCAPLAGQACGMACPVQDQPASAAALHTEAAQDDHAPPCAAHAMERDAPGNPETGPACPMQSGCALAALPMVFLPNAGWPAMAVTDIPVVSANPIWIDHDPRPLYRPPIFS